MVRNSFFGDLFGTHTTTYSIRKGKVSKKSSVSRWLGYKIYEDQNGGFSIPELDSSVFDTKSDAKRFISAWVKGNKEQNPGTIVYIKNPADWFAKCVKGVKKSDSGYDPNAICASVLRRKKAKKRLKY